MTYHQKNKIVLNRTVYNVDIHRLIVNFSRCFISGSMPGGEMGTKSSENDNLKLCDALSRFTSCTHSTDELLSVGENENP